jgi:hypothetical protein
LLFSLGASHAGWFFNPALWDYEARVSTTVPLLLAKLIFKLFLQFNFRGLRAVDGFQPLNLD